MYKEKVVDAITGEESWREYDAEEINAVKKAQELVEEQHKKNEEKKQQRATILEKLGLTEEEATVLLG